MATLSVAVRDGGPLVANVSVHFVVNGSIVGDAVTDSRGKARVWLQGFAPGLHRGEVSSPEAGNTLVIPRVVRR